MRGRGTCGVAAVFSFAAAGGAIAGSGTTVQTYEQSYLETRVNKSTGMSLEFTSTDPANPRNAQPKRITGFDMYFPEGSRLDPRGAPACRADLADFRARGEGACR